MELSLYGCFFLYITVVVHDIEFIVIGEFSFHYMINLIVLFILLSVFQQFYIESDFLVSAAILE